MTEKILNCRHYKKKLINEIQLVLHIQNYVWMARMMDEIIAVVGPPIGRNLGECSNRVKIIARNVFIFKTLLLCNVQSNPTYYNIKLTTNL